MEKEVIMRVSYGIRICLLVAVWMGFPSLLGGQNPADVRDWINTIKLDEQYLYAEVTHQDLNWAYENALSELLLAVNGRRASVQKPPLSVSDLTGRVEQLDYRRGEKSVAFVYMQVPQALAMQSRGSRNIVVGVAGQESEVESEILVKHYDEPEEAVPVASASPAEVKPLQPEPPVVVSESVNTELKNLADDEVARVILRIEMVTDIGGFMEKFKAKGQVAAYGVARSMQDIPDDAYLILFDRTWAIRTILSPVVQGKRLNLRSNKEDAVTNYSGHGVYWYKK